MMNAGIELPARVVAIGESADFHERARGIVGQGAELVLLGPGDAIPDCALAIVECTATAEVLLGRVRESAPGATVLVLGPESGPAYQLVLGASSALLARMTYAQVKRLTGSLLVPRYLDVLLVRHEGNVTKAALTARLERETLHRLLRQHGLSPTTYRRPRG